MRTLGGVTGIALTPEQRGSIGIDRAANQWCDQGMGKIVRATCLCVALVLLAGSPKPPGHIPPEERGEVEAFVPGKAEHSSADVDALTRRAAQVLVTAFEMEAKTSPGIVMTEWGPWDAQKWPGIFTRMVITIGDRFVTVDVQCRTRHGSCTGALPDGSKMSRLAQRIADAIVEGYEPKLEAPNDPPDAGTDGP